MLIVLYVLTSVIVFIISTILFGVLLMMYDQKHVYSETAGLTFVIIGVLVTIIYAILTYPVWM